MTKNDDTNQNDRPIGEMSYEEAIEALESITDAIESGEIGLEKSVTEYERGVALLNHCRSLLEDAEQRIEELSGEDLVDEDADT